MIIKVNSDGSNSVDGKHIRFVSVISVYGDIASVQTEDGGPGWSDVAEYSAIKQGLLRLIQLKLNDEKIIWEGDSQFVMKQLQGEWRVKSGRAYTQIAKECMKLIKEFNNITFKWIPREENKVADTLSKIQKDKLDGLSHSQSRKDAVM